MSKRYARLIKDSGFENSDGLEGEALFSAFLEWKVEAAHVDGDVKGMTKEELLKHPVVKTIVNEVKEREKSVFAQKEKEYSEKIAKAEMTRSDMLLEKYIRDQASKNKAKLGEDPETENLRITAIKAVLPQKRQINDSGELVFLGDDGYERTDVDSVFAKAVNAFGYVQKQDPKKEGAGANGSRSSGNAGGGANDVPQYTFANGLKDLDTYLRGAKDNTDRAQIHKDWKFHQEKTTAAGS